MINKLEKHINRHDAILKDLRVDYKKRLQNLIAGYDLSIHYYQMRIYRSRIKRASICAKTKCMDKLKILDYNTFDVSIS